MKRSPYNLPNLASSVFEWRLVAPLRASPTRERERERERWQAVGRRGGSGLRGGGREE
jgi:hypothetical protein